MKISLKPRQKKFLFLFAMYVLIFSLTQETYASLGITNEVTSGRLGDNIIQYIKTKWFAWKYNFTFYFQPFEGSEFLNASVQEQRFSDTIAQPYDRHIAVRHETDITGNLESGTLFIVKPYTGGLGFNTEDFINYLLLNCPHEFLDHSRQLLLPRNLPIMPPTPEKRISVAIHVRRPSLEDYPLFSVQEYDSSPYETVDELIELKETTKTVHIPQKTLYSHINNGPLKFPPLQFYSDALKKLSTFFGGAPLHVYLFTDDPEPQSLVEIMKKSIDNASISFENRSVNWQKHIIDDYYQMSQFDCLIKSISTFSSISQLLGNHAVTIFPSEYAWEDNKLIIKKRTWLIRQHEVNYLTQEQSHQ